MSEGKKNLFILGVTGFVGRQTAQAALKQGWQVTAIARNPQSAQDLASAGVRIIQGDASQPGEWIKEAAGSDVLMDLVQPKLPERIGLKQIEDAASERLQVTRRLLDALKTIPQHRRPMLFSVSGLDDLAPHSSGHVDEGSGLRKKLSGFAHIGVPVRRLIEESKADASFIYLATVYGPGKAFAGSVFPKLAAGKFRIPGNGENRMPLMHVEDVARALIHLASLPPEQLSGRSVIVADGNPTTMNQFFAYAASLMDAPKPKRAPLWLARLLLGSVQLETLNRNITVEPATLQQTGFKFLYPTYREGLPPTLEQLGYGSNVNRREKSSRVRGSNVGLIAAFLLVLAVMIAVNTVVFPGSAAQIAQFSKGLPLLDMRLHYNEHELYRLFDVLGPLGRRIYLQFYWTVDLIMPAMFGLFLWAVIRSTPLRRFKWLAFLAAGLDYAENICVTVLLLRYPVHVPALATVSSAFTTAKWVAYAIAVIVAILGILGVKFDHSASLPYSKKFGRYDASSSC